jgi:hypothetical protein
MATAAAGAAHRRAARGLSVRARRRALARGHLCRQQIAAPGHGPDEALRRVAQRRPELVDALHERVVGDADRSPDGGEERLLAHDPVRGLGKDAEDVEGLRTKANLVGPSAEQPHREVEREALERQQRER